MNEQKEYDLRKLFYLIPKLTRPVPVDVIAMMLGINNSRVEDVIKVALQDNMDIKRYHHNGGGLWYVNKSYKEKK